MRKIIERIPLAFTAIMLLWMPACSPSSPAEVEGSALSPVSVVDGVLRDANGDEVNLWGFNFQPMMSWEYDLRMKQQGVLYRPSFEELKKVTLEGFDQIESLGAGVIRIHLIPADFTDGTGVLRDSLWLQVLDFTLAEAARRGIYVSLSMINHLVHDGNYECDNENAFTVVYSRSEWMYDPQSVAISQRYLKEILNRANPFDGGRLYKDNPAFILIEPINEPHYPTREDVLNSPGMKTNYDAWLAEQGARTDDPQSFRQWRAAATLEYIESFKRLIRAEGMRQPVIWNCGWPRLIQNNEDVFKAIADSSVEAISVCLYPGQDDLPQPVWQNLRDLTNVNYLPYLQNVSARHDWLGWMRDPIWDSKAKVVYEFETFCNSSGYLYPQMAKLFRSLGVQVATLWTYSLPVYATHLGGSHVFNLDTTPHKVASYLIAGEVFEYLPMGIEYSKVSPTQDRFGPFVIDYKLRLAAASFEHTLMYSNDLPEGLIQMPDDLQRIVGVGQSPVVQTDGNGLYVLEAAGANAWDVQITPRVKALGPHWLENHRAVPLYQLEWEQPVRLEVSLPGHEPTTLEVMPTW